MIYKLLAPDWLVQKGVKKRVIEKIMTFEQAKKYNEQGYNVYCYMNRPKNEKATLTRRKADPDKKWLQGSDIDVFNYVFVDMDLKDGHYKSKKQFIEYIESVDCPPSNLIDSGNGVHAFWRVTDLDAMGFLRLQRRLASYLKTDENVAKLNQTNRVPGMMNTKDPNDLKPVEALDYTGKKYTSEELDRWLPPISIADEEYCKLHYRNTHNPQAMMKEVDLEIPRKFKLFLRESEVVRRLFYGPTDDRSKADYKLGHLLYANGFTRKEAMSVLLNVEKALERSGSHRYNYANSIVDKIWQYETDPDESDEETVEIICTPASKILASDDETDLQPRLYGHKLFDATQHGFRLGQLWGIVAGAGVGKTLVSLNQFRWFSQNNPEYLHIFFSLELNRKEITKRWKKMCKDSGVKLDNVWFADNYDDKGLFRNISVADIRNQIKAIQKSTGRKIGCVVIDHLDHIAGAEKGKLQDDKLKVAIRKSAVLSRETDTFVILLSQTSRAKAGIGDIELDKDAAFGTMMFEAYCDYVTTLWQPLKRAYHQMEKDFKLTAMAYKFGKIREKDVVNDDIQEDVVYACFVDPKTELIRKLTEEEVEMYRFWNKQAADLRKKDKKSEPAEIVETTWVVESNGE